MALCLFHSPARESPAQPFVPGSSCGGHAAGATIGAAIGAGGLGVFIFHGIATVNNTLLLAGALPAAAIALLVDAALAALESSLNRSALPQPQPQRRGRNWDGIGAKGYTEPQPRQQGRLALCLQRQADGLGALAMLHIWIEEAVELGASAADSPRQELFGAEAWLLELLLVLPAL